MGLDDWTVVSERIASFDKMLLDLRLKVLGYSAIAAGAVALLGEKTAVLDRQGTALLFLFIALAVAAVAITDVSYYYQLLCSAVGVAQRMEKDGTAVRRPESALVDT